MSVCSENGASTVCVKLDTGPAHIVVGPTPVLLRTSDGSIILSHDNKLIEVSK